MILDNSYKNNLLKNIESLSNGELIEITLEEKSKRVINYAKQELLNRGIK